MVSDIPYFLLELTSTTFPNIEGEVIGNKLQVRECLRGDIELNSITSKDS